MGLVPVFHGLHGVFGAEGWLGQVVVVQGHVSQQGLSEIVAAAAVVRLEHIGNAAVKATLIKC